jgi:hypothetical protein
MAFKDDIVSERVKIVRCVFKSKLGKKISNEILNPILDALEKGYPDMLDNVGREVRNSIVEYLMTSEPTGRTYRIYTYDPSAPYGSRTELIGEHVASAPGEPPAALTGTLANSIEYQVHADGSLYIGILRGWGEYSDAKTELKSAFYRFGNIVISLDESVIPNKQTPVGTYSRWHGRWYEDIMEVTRPLMRKRLRKDLRNLLNKTTKKTSVRKAVVFKIYFG